ncbi:PAS domain S-box protein [Sesbania bispinosa]|nr:PAS domain S-box protein [Sesbania bispinosa]
MDDELDMGWIPMTAAHYASVQWNQKFILSGTVWKCARFGRDYMLTIGMAGVSIKIWIGKTGCV